jgi:prepilin peptidase CpaA
MSLNELLAVAVALVACAFDVHSRRIPNVLTFGAALAAFGLAGVTGGLDALGSSGAGWLLATAMWLPIYALGGMGAGDVKLMAAIGAFLGPGAVLYAALYAAIAGGVMGLGVAVAQRCVRQTYENIQLLILHWRVAGFAPHPQIALETATSPRLAYALPILAGTGMAIWLR